MTIVGFKKEIFFILALNFKPGISNHKMLWLIG
jgi:hypothetical protein